mgnify:FL=1
MFKARERARQEYQDALTHYGITDEQAREFIEGTRYAKTFYKAPHVAAGTGADLIHEIGPLVGKGRIGRAKVHTVRAAARAKSLVTEDLPQAKETFDKMAPYIPSLARLIYVELKEKVPAPKQAWNKLMRRAVPTAEDESIPSSHEHIPAPAASAEDETDNIRLQVVS